MQDILLVVFQIIYYNFLVGKIYESLPVEQICACAPTFPAVATAYFFPFVHRLQQVQQNKQNPYRYGFGKGTISL